MGWGRRPASKVPWRYIWYHDQEVHAESRICVAIWNTRELIRSLCWMYFKANLLREARRSRASPVHVTSELGNTCHIQALEGLGVVSRSTYMRIVTSTTWWAEIILSVSLHSHRDRALQWQCSALLFRVTDKTQLFKCLVLTNSFFDWKDNLKPHSDFWSFT